MKGLRLFCFTILFSFPLYAVSVSTSTANKLNYAIKLVEQKNYVKAIQVLESANPTRREGQAMVSRMLGIVYWQSNNIESAIQHLHQAVQGEVLDERTYGTERMLADLYYHNSQFELSIKHYKRLIQLGFNDEENRELQMMLASSMYQLGNWQQVIDTLQMFPYQQGAQDVTPLSLMFNAQINAKELTGAIETAKRIIGHKPRDIMWIRNVVNLYVETKQYYPALDTLVTAYGVGLNLLESDLKLIVQLYQELDLPFAAGRLSEESRANTLPALKMEAYYWQAAREWGKASTVLEKMAEMDNRYYWDLALTYYRTGDYVDSLNAVEQLEDQSESQVVDLKNNLSLLLN
ncbi:tetratricopeptide repeat protein [Vibrio sonorensis]|uniref:tetratricopeptide repeat protein n=1 Tax=Vibrio sonorensis TaxID=1004316 RepID=UPI0008DABD04|nr:tetratricopeptide repeat protein [Vibrio sonorensis]